MTGRITAVLVLVWGATTGLWGLEADMGVTVGHTLAAVSAGPPGTPVQEVGTDRARWEAVAGHKQAFGGGWSAEGLGRFGLDTLPSNNPRALPEAKLEPSAAVLEAWLGWEPVPGVLGLGAGKRRIQPSSGFSAKPLDALARDDDREGRTGAQVGWFGEAASVSVFAGPGWTQEGIPDGFFLARAGTSVGATDLKVQVFHSSGPPRAGAGIDGSWGDHLTLRAEAAADAAPSSPRAQALGGFTWTADDLSTLMAEASWDGRETDRWTGFVRGTVDLGQGWEGQGWLKAEVAPWEWTKPSGWTGLALSWKAPKWSLDAGWTGAWGSAGTPAGDSPFRWKTEVTAKVFL